MDNNIPPSFAYITSRTDSVGSRRWSFCGSGIYNDSCYVSELILINCSAGHHNVLVPRFIMTYLLTMGESAVRMVSRPGEVVALGGVLSPVASQNSSTGHTLDPHDKGCENGALMDSFGIFLQGLIGVVAFSLLMLKRFREPKHERRPWRIWFLDTSKQAIGMLFIHFANVYLSDLTGEDPCSLYLINFLLDASLGMLLIYAGVRVVSAVVEWRQWDSLRFGEYGESVQCTAWAGQCALYIFIMMFEKVVIVLVLLIPQWKQVREWVDMGRGRG